MIEVEMRAFINKGKHEELLNYFNSNAEAKNVQKQITSYFDCEQDFRLMETNQGYCQLWLKKGKLHDDSREELIVKTDEAYKNTLLKMFKELGYGIKIKWYRVRRSFKWKDISVSLDYTFGYGYILEFEICVEDEEQTEAAKEKLRNVFEHFQIPITDKKIFAEKFEDYQKKWREYTKGIDEELFIAD